MLHDALTVGGDFQALRPPGKVHFEVLLELALIRASELLSSQFRSTFYGQRADPAEQPGEKLGLALG